MDAVTPSMGILNSKLYVGWIEHSAGADQVRVAVFNGDNGTPSWSFVDGGGTTGINKNATKTAASVHLAVLNSKLYAAWTEVGTSVANVRVSVFSGDDSSLELGLCRW